MAQVWSVVGILGALAGALVGVLLFSMTMLRNELTSRMDRIERDIADLRSNR